MVSKNKEYYRKNALRTIAEMISENVGERCKEHYEGCLICECWKLFDELNDAHQKDGE